MRRLVAVLLCGMCFGQEILRPTQNIDPGNVVLGCTGTNQASTAMPSAHDAAGLTTFSSLAVGGDDLHANKSSRYFAAWAPTSNIYTALTLNVNAQFSAQPVATGCIKYSIDGGIIFTTLKCTTSSFGRQTYTVTLDIAQDLSKLKVGVCASGAKGNSHAGLDSGVMNVSIYDIWTAGTNPSPAGGDGSTSGQPHRGAVVSN